MDGIWCRVSATPGRDALASPIGFLQAIEACNVSAQAQKCQPRHLEQFLAPVTCPSRGIDVIDDYIVLLGNSERRCYGFVVQVVFHPQLFGNRIFGVWISWSSDRKIGV